MTVATTARLVLRRLVPSDREALTPIFSDADVMRFGDGPQTLEWINDWLRRVLESYERRGYGPWAVVEKRSGLVIGYCGLVLFPDVNGRPENEIGYRLARAFWGRGYATEAAIATRDHAFATLGLSRLIAIIDPGNVASIRVARKAGLHHETDVMLSGYTYPDRLYAIQSPRGS